MAFFLGVLVLGLALSFTVTHSLVKKGPSLVRDDPPPGQALNPAERWLTQKADQLTYADKRTWQQRYFINKDHYVPGGPVFLMLSGEREANPVWLTNGQWVRQAINYKAMLLLLEHRYYGMSRPTPDLSVTNLKYLTVEQALADTAYFRGYISESLSLSNDTKWLIYGGSYAGTLAAWFRLTHPELVNAVIASSAPVYPQKDFKEYYEVTSMSLLQHGSAECYTALQNATVTLSNYSSIPGGRSQLPYILTLCSDIESSRPADMATLFSFMASAVGNVVQFNNVNRQFEGVKGWDYNIKSFCQTMSGDQPYPQTPIYRYSNFLSMALKNMDQKCIEYRYTSYVDNLRDTEWSSEVAQGERQWLYQTCTEFGFFASSDSKNQPFGSSFPSSYFVQLCTDVLGKSFQEYVLDEGIYNLREKYGGYSPNISHAIFVNGGSDPWMDLSITKNRPNDVTAITIQGAAHCADMYPDSPMDTVELVQARLTIDTIIDGWLKGPNRI